MNETARTLRERAEAIWLYAQDTMTTQHVAAGAQGNLMSIRDEATAILDALSASPLPRPSTDVEGMMRADLIERLELGVRTCGDITMNGEEIYDIDGADTVMAEAVTALTSEHELRVKAERERDDARETNRALNRRVQKWEGAETSFRMSFDGWAKVLFKHVVPDATLGEKWDFQSWQKGVDKEWANGRAESAEARASDLAAQLAEADKERDDLRAVFEPAKHAVMAVVQPVLNDLADMDPLDLAEYHATRAETAEAALVQARTVLNEIAHASGTHAEVAVMAVGAARAFLLTDPEHPQ